MAILRVSHKNNFVTVHKEAINNPYLSFQAIGLWVYLMGKPDNWTVSVSQLSNKYLGNRRGNGEKGIRECIKELISEGYITREQNRKDDGLWDNVSYVVHEQSLKECLPHRLKRHAVERLAVKEGLPKTKSMTKPLLRKVNDSTKDSSPSSLNPKEVIEESLPFSEEKKKTNTSSKCKYPLKKDQQAIFDLLKILDLECEDDVLYILIRTHSVDKIVDAIAHLRNSMENTKNPPRSRIAVLRSVLNGKVIPVTDRCQANRKIAEEFAESRHWKTLKIRDKYCLCEETQFEIPTHFEEQDFIQRLEQGYELYMGCSK